MKLLETAFTDEDTVSPPSLPIPRVESHDHDLDLMCYEAINPEPVSHPSSGATSLSSTALPVGATSLSSTAQPGSRINTPGQSRLISDPMAPSVRAHVIGVPLSEDGGDRSPVALIKARLEHLPPPLKHVAYIRCRKPTCR